MITHDRIRVRRSGGWQVWVLADLDGWGVMHQALPPATGMWSLGSSAVLVGLLAFQMRGWVVPVAIVLFAVALMVAYWERRRARSRSCSQLWASYKGGDEVVIFELPRSQFETAVRGLVRALQQRPDTE
ncbi:DUF6232 family protein [Actinoplanes sp. NPDC051633]|uniref:DUF6232 family protein n=1 Tax=Actinoplanes sp. NPDC051633 TaxID=3155670 RepID=UPI0034192387